VASQFLACFALVSAFYQLPPNVLPSIAAVEGGRPRLEAPNKDGSADLGVMQINTLWIAPLAHHTRQPESAVRWRLLHEPCFNIATAGAIVRIYLNRANGNLMQAIGDYHSHTPVRHNAYRLKVLEAAGRLAQQLPMRLPGRLPRTPPRQADQLQR
jgi:hypothetical protein